jgi:hypothetical protein
MSFLKFGATYFYENYGVNKDQTEELPAVRIRLDTRRQYCAIYNRGHVIVKSCRLSLTRKR